jgi:hypothetical protein
MSFKLYSEILEEFHQMQTKKERIEVLRKYESQRFRTFLEYCFNPDIKFDVTIAPYKASLNPAGLNELYIDGEIGKFYRFIQDHPNRTAGFGGKKQENILTAMMESFHKDEAELVTRMINKNLSIPFLTPVLLREAYPNINL